MRTRMGNKQVRLSSKKKTGNTVPDQEPGFCCPPPYSIHYTPPLVDWGEMNLRLACFLPLPLGRDSPFFTLHMVPREPGRSWIGVGGRKENSHIVYLELILL